MKRNRFIASTASVLVGGVSIRASATPALSNIDASGEPLRTAFNADAGRVRIMMLVSPT